MQHSRDAFRPVSGIMYPFPRTNVMRTRWCQENRHMIRALSDAERRDVKALIVAWNNEQPLASLALLSVLMVITYDHSGTYRIFYFSHVQRREFYLRRRGLI